MNPTVSIFAEIPETLHDSLKTYLETHPEWDLDRVFSASLSLFLLQNADSSTPEASRSYRQAARVYLETLFQYPHQDLHSNNVTPSS
ncbi:DUF2811 domain-containing protein [Microcoleus sp. A003_D6]|uniref:DUF2811 domain-containing protein n=1 Tax=Microcoleus sp. A003_D6 TaxID=3055266 RepID=UPI002FD67B33